MSVHTNTLPFGVHALGVHYQTRSYVSQRSTHFAMKSLNCLDHLAGLCKTGGLFLREASSTHPSLKYSLQEDYSVMHSYTLHYHAHHCSLLRIPPSVIQQSTPSVIYTPFSNPLQCTSSVIHSVYVLLMNCHQYTLHEALSNFTQYTVMQPSVIYLIYFGILKRALMGFSPNSGGVLSAISMAVIPSDQTSALAS